MNILIDVKESMDKVFIHFAKRSGMYEREDYIHKIDLKGKLLDTGIKDEFIDLFRPQNTEGFLTYSEYLNGLR